MSAPSSIPELRLEEKSALVTGAGRGIGAGIARVLVEAGANVVVNARTATSADHLAKILAGTGSGHVAAEPGDLTRPDEVARVVDASVRRLGGLDILVSCVGDGIFGSFVDPGPAAEAQAGTTLPPIRESLDINVLTAVYTAHAVAGRLVAQGAGKILTVSSHVAVRARSERVVYTTAKSAVVGLTRSLALELAPHNVQVNAIAPGIVPDDADGGREDYLRAVERANRLVPMSRPGSPREMGLVALFLVSPAADYVTGQVISCDGGMTL